MKIIEANPFGKFKCPVGTDKTKQFFVTREMAAAILQSCPNDEWRLLFSLARFAGLRIPSEAAGMLWSDINFEKDKFWVRSPKTEHHDGGEGRWVPIFPELRALFGRVFTEARDCATHVFPQIHGSQNLRTRFM